MDQTADKSTSSSTRKGTASATVPARTRPSTGRHKRITPAFLTTAGTDTRVETSLGRVKVVARAETTDIYGRERRSTVRAEEGIDTGEDIGRTRGKAETMESGEGMGVIAEAMGIHQT